jgi:3-oxoacyl-[acyl-carrier-protein] synthase-3
LTGIKERRVCMQGEDSYTLAVNAARDCLNHSRYLPKDLDMILCCSISKQKGETSYQYEPPFSLFIKDSIGAVNAINFDITNACAGMLTGVYIADTFIRRGSIRSCMVVSGEYITSMSDHAVTTIRSLLGSELASLTLGDAGAAVIVERSPDSYEGLIVTNFTTLSQYNHLCIGKQRRKYPGFFMKTNARKIHEVSISDSTCLVRDALEKNGLSLDQIDYLIPHQTSRSSIYSGVKHYSDFFGTRPGKVVVNLKEFGNTASTTHFLALYRYLNEQRFHQGDRIMLLSFASGLIIGIVIFTMNGMAWNYGRQD